MGALRPDDRFAVGDDGVGELREQERSGRPGPAAFGDMLPVVEADAHDLVRRRERRVRGRRCRAGCRPRPRRASARRRSWATPAAEVGVAEVPVEDRDQPVADQEAGAAIVIGSEVRDETHRRFLAQLGRRCDAGARDRARRSAWRSGDATLGAGLALAAGDPLGAALPLGLGAAHCCSGLVFSPHCCQKARILAWSNVSRGRTRPQTIAWNGVDIWSKRAMTGPMTPFGDAAHGAVREGVEEGAQLGLAVGRRAGARPGKRTTSAPCSRLWTQPCGMTLSLGP